MGRFYQTAEPTFVDNKMFEAPHELMRQVLLGKDKAIDDKISDAVSFYDKLTADVLQQDTPRAKEIVKGYEQQINDIVSGIQKNPLEYNKYSNTIRELGRGINKDWTMGEIGTMQGYKKQVTEEWNKLDELAKKDPETYDASYVAAEKAAILKEYQGINWNKDLGKAGNAPAIQGSYHGLNFDLDEYLKTKMEADGYTRERDSTGNGYIYRNKTSNEVLSPQKVAEATVSYFNANPDIQSAVQRRGELGIEGFVGADINNALKYDREGNLQGYGDNYYGRMAEAAAKHKAYSKTEKSDTIHADSTAMTKMGWARADAKEKAEKEAEHVDLAPVHVYTLGTENTKSLSENLKVTNVALAAKQKDLADNAKSLKLQPGTERYKAFMSGDVKTMVAAGMDEGTAQQMSSAYKAERTKKNFLNDQVQGFRDYLSTKGKNSSQVGKLGWTKDKNLANEYNNYLKANNKFNDGKKVVTNLSSLNNMNIPEKTIKEAQGVFAQNFEHLTFNIDQTYKGQHLKFEDQQGNTVVYIPQDSKIKSGTREEKSGKTTIYLKAPDGKMSVQDLIRRGLVQTKTESYNDEQGKPQTRKVFTTRQNGKNVGMVLNEKTLRVVNALDDKGQSNYSSTLQIGNNRMDILVPTKQMPIPSVDAYINDNYEDLQFNRYMNQADLESLGRRESKGPNGSKFRTEKGKAYIIYADGRKTEVTDDITKREIYKINYFEND